ncbi:hypothetical protein CASFOL_027427 [Castilleja foliolosa]|uniref:Uncharacterized protein n=1 Tax=Castilleja foliolosa TaxID=1961234 RepID=A0ABD3CGC0_9LAMI
MAILSHKFKCMLKKKIISFKTGNHGHVGYKTLEELEKDEKKSCCAPKGYVHVYVGEYEPQVLYRVRTGAFNSPAIAALLDEYRDDINYC